MIRNDFVSNSSSCSFIIENPKEIYENNKLGLEFFNILSTIPSGSNRDYENGYITFISKNKSFSKKLIENVQKLNENGYGYDFDIEEHNSIITLYNPYILYNIYKLRIMDVDTLTELFKESKEVHISHGLDDCGDKQCLFGGIINLLNYNFGAEIDSDDCNVDLVKDVMKRIEDYE